MDFNDKFKFTCLILTMIICGITEPEIKSIMNLMFGIALGGVFTLLIKLREQRS